MNDLILAIIAFATATLTAVAGVGGGMIMVASMPGLIPAPAIVPVHALVQFVSNSSRILFGLQFLKADFVVAFVAGAVAGGFLATSFLSQINLQYTPLLIAAYILYSVWGPKLKFQLPQRFEFSGIGLIQTALSMVVATTGPMGMAALARRGYDRDALVVNSAVMMSITQGVKVVMFTLLGFSLVAYWQTVAGMCAGVILGGLVGTRIRYRVPEKAFKQVIKWLLTLLAIRMIYLTLA